jgi:hypothetical protein
MSVSSIQYRLANISEYSCALDLGNRISVEFDTLSDSKSITVSFPTGNIVSTIDGKILFLPNISSPISEKLPLNENTTYLIPINSSTFHKDTHTKSLSKIKITVPSINKDNVSDVNHIIDVNHLIDVNHSNIHSTDTTVPCDNLIISTNDSFVSSFSSVIQNKIKQNDPDFKHEFKPVHKKITDEQLQINTIFDAICSNIFRSIEQSTHQSIVKLLDGLNEDHFQKFTFEPKGVSQNKLRQTVLQKIHFNKNVLQILNEYNLEILYRKFDPHRIDRPHTAQLFLVPISLNFNHK